MSPHWFPRRTWPLALPLVLALTVTPAAGASAAPDPGGQPPATAPAPAGAGQSLTLVTGDQVRLSPAGQGRWAATVDPAPRAGQEPTFETFEVGEDIYIVPSDAAPLVPERLDRELFNVTKLAEYGYTDGVPVIVTGNPARATPAATAGMAVSTALPSVGGYAATVTSDGGWWTARGRQAAALAGRVWLDEQAEIALDESVPIVGAPEAWAAGYDGTGVTVAVLDTGIDTEHPDLAGQVVGAQNFTSEPDTRDRNGHGTHVAGTVAGTGAASGGAYTGVAPGAELLNGKICDQTGSCQNSGIIAAMQWAAPLADVVSVSVGTNTGSDGTDPMSQAVNTLTAQHDTLFVIAAGNNGLQGSGSIASPGAADAALTVGSVDKNGNLAGTSSRGPRLGDFAVKPDITAPGVNIVAPRGAGTAMGTPVDDYYTSASGTSMATPHVSGAAAILLQQDPGRSAAGLKAALATTAFSSGSRSVYEQGGGRLYIPAALNAPADTSPAPLNLGYFPYPHEDASTVTEVTYTNRTGGPLDMYPSVSARDEDGSQVPGSVLSVEPSFLTVPAGGTATVTVTLDATALDTGLYSGYLYAGLKGGDVDTAIGFYKEPETYQLSVEGYARDGRPAAAGSSINVMDVIAGTDEFLETSVDYVDGVATVRVPPGTYDVMGTIYTYDGHHVYPQDRSMMAVSEVVVTQDTAIVFDARDASPVVIDTPAHPDAAPFGYTKYGVVRRPVSGRGFSYGLTGSYWQPTYALATEPVTHGTFEYHSRTRIGEPWLELAVTGPVDLDLNPRRFGDSVFLEGEHEVPLVFAGPGSDFDYRELDVAGKAALVTRGGVSLPVKAAAAAAHGAVALLVMNDTTGTFDGSVGAGAEIPAMSVSGQEGALLRDLLAGGEVTIRLAGTLASPYLYDLVYVEPGAIPNELHYVAEPEQLATVVNAFHSPPDQLLGETRHSFRPNQGASIGIYTELAGPLERTEYFTGGDTRYQLVVGAEFPSLGTTFEALTTYQAGEQRHESRFASPMRPGLLEGSPHQEARPAVRNGDTLELFLTEWGDSEAHWGYLAGGTDTAAFRLFQDGELIAQAPNARANFPVSPDPATYRLELDVTRDADWWPTSTATRTAWTVHSERGQYTLPLLLADYDLDLDLTNTAPRPLPSLELQVRHQPGHEGAPIRQADMWVSYDGGLTWEPVVVQPRGGGAFLARFVPPVNPSRDAQFASLRVAAADQDGNRIEQEIINAWRLP